MKRAFDRKGYLRKDVKKIIHAEGNRIRRFYARNRDICPRDLTLLLLGEVQLAGALANIDRQAVQPGERDEQRS